MDVTEPWPVEALYLRNPTMDYSQAFDLALAGWAAEAGPALAVVSSPVHAVEVLKRWPGSLHLVGSGAFDAADFVSQTSGWAWGNLAAAPLPPQRARGTPAITGDQTASKYKDLIWAEPEAGEADTIAQALRRAAAPGARLSVIASGGLRRHLPAWQTLPRPAQQPLAPGTVGRALRAAGWQVHGRVALHGPRAIAWTRLAQWAERLGRPDWGDRCLFAMRASYHEPGWLWRLAAVALILARAA